MAHRRGGPVTLEVLNLLAMLEVKRIAPAPRVTDFFKEDIGWRNSLSAISIQNESSSSRYARHNMVARWKQNIERFSDKPYKNLHRKPF